MITIVGTGHVFDLSSKISQIIEEKIPNLICVELDEKRYLAMISKDRESRDLPLMYKILSRFQQRVADWYGTKAGEEMLIAIKIAGVKGIDVKFIDMDAEMVFERFWKSMGFGEKIKMIFSGIIGLISGRKIMEREIDRFKDRVDEIIEEVGKKFPSMKRILIDERDEYMARKLEELSKDYRSIMAFVGDGHVPGIERYLRSRNLEVEVIRLKDLQSNATISFTTQVDP